MLQNTKELYGKKLSALDGDIGQVKDFYFDDQSWVIRYLVADTGTWLTGRLVLLSPHAFGKLDQFENTLHVKLQKKQIQDSPSIETHKPVSRQYEIEYYRYYGWPVYWEGGMPGLGGLGGFPVILPPPQEEVDAHLKPLSREDKHLRSTHAITGYQIQASDGLLGEVRSFLLDDKSWAIRDVVVDTGPWYSGNEILIPTARIERISYEDSTVFVSLTKTDIQQTAENHVAKHHPVAHGAARSTD